MNDELILWRYRLASFFNLLGKTAVEQLLTGTIALLALVGLVVLFYTIGQYATGYTANYQWVSIGLALTFLAGFLSHIRPLTLQNSLLFLPLGSKTITWHNVSAGLRFPVIASAALVIPYFVGKNSNWYYTSADLVVLVVGTVALLTAGYLVAVAVALGIRTVTRHSFIRLLAIIAVLVLAFEFFVGPNAVIAAIEQTLLEVNRTAMFLLLIGSLGVSGVAVALIELCEPLPTEHQPRRFWSVLQKTRNFRATFGEAEAAFIRSFLAAVRQPQLHLRLLLLLIFLLAFRSILVSTVPQYPSLQIALHALGLGIAAYLICFSAGQESVKSEQKLFFVPSNKQRTVTGSYLATLAVFGLFISLFAGPNPLVPVLTYTIAAVIGSVAFMFGRREAQAISMVPLTWLVLLIALPTILAIVLGTIVENATPAETVLVTIIWSVAYLALPLLFTGSARLKPQAAVQ